MPTSTAAAEKRGDIAALLEAAAIDASGRAGASPTTIFHSSSALCDFMRPGLCRVKGCGDSSARCALCLVSLRCHSCKMVQQRAVRGNAGGVTAFRKGDAKDFCDTMDTPTHRLPFDAADFEAAYAEIMVDAAKANAAKAADPYASTPSAELKHASAYADIGARADVVAEQGAAVLRSLGVCVSCVTAARLDEPPPRWPASVQRHVSWYARVHLPHWLLLADVVHL